MHLITQIRSGKQGSGEAVWLGPELREGPEVFYPAIEGKDPR